MDHRRLHRAGLALALVCATGCGAATAPPPAGPSPQGRVAAPPAAAAAAPAIPAESPLASATVSGRVTSQADGSPLGRARVILSSPAMAEPRVAITAADGAFRFDTLPSGTYSLAVSRTGFATTRFGERRSAPPEAIAVSEGQSVNGVDVALQPAGVIAGRILDEDERPFTGAIVEALVSRTIDGRASFVAVASAETDDRGEFRLAGLPAGHYYVSAFDPAFERVGDESGPLRYTPTYYPGVIIAEEAERVTVTPAAEPKSKIALRLQIVRPARVAGILKTRDGRQLISGAVVMAPIRGEGVSTVPSQDVTILPDGAFTFRNVPPGHYQIRARGDVEQNGVTRFATFRVRVEGRDVDNLELTLVPGATVHGRIVVEPARRTPRPDWSRLRVRAPFVDGTSFGDTLDGQVQPDGAYGIHGVMAGRHVLAIEGLPYPWVVKSVTWRGQDVSDMGIDAETLDEFSDVRITITDAAAEVTGVVRGTAAEPVADALVLIIPPAPQFWTRTSRRFAVTRTDAGGRFQLRGLPPGEYRAVATLEFDDAEAYHPGVIKSLAAAGRPMTIGENRTEKLDLALTSLASLTRATAR